MRKGRSRSAFKSHCSSVEVENRRRRVRRDEGRRSGDMQWGFGSRGEFSRMRVKPWQLAGTRRVKCRCCPPSGKSQHDQRLAEVRRRQKRRPNRCSVQQLVFALGMRTSQAGIMIVYGYRTLPRLVARSWKFHTVASEIRVSETLLTVTNGVSSPQGVAIGKGRDAKARGGQQMKADVEGCEEKKSR